MSIEIGTTVNNAADALLRAPIVKNMVQNPIYTALLIAFIIVLIVLWVFREAETEDSLLTTSLRVGFWSFLLVLGIIFLHNRVLSFESHEEKANTAYGGVFGANEPAPVHSGLVSLAPVYTLETATVPVTPTTFGF
jgi:hypothetical protein